MGMVGTWMGMDGYGKDVNGNECVWKGCKWEWMGMGGIWVRMDGYGRDMNKNGWVWEGHEWELMCMGSLWIRMMGKGRIFMGMVGYGKTWIRIDGNYVR